MNFKLTLTLAIIVILLCSLLYWLKDTKPAAKTTESASMPLLAPAPEKLATIAYLHDGQQQVAFKRNGEKGEMTFPRESPVEIYKVANLAEDLQMLGYKERFEPQASGAKSAQA